MFLRDRSQVSFLVFNSVNILDLNFRDREVWIRDKKRIDAEMNNKLVTMKKRATTSGRLFHHIQVNLNIAIKTQIKKYYFSFPLIIGKFIQLLLSIEFVGSCGL